MEKATQKKKLKLDPGFTPCPQEEDDELFPNGIFVFNITKLEEEIRRLPQRFRMEEVQVSRFPAEFSSLNEDHVDNVDPTKPIILAEIAPNHYNVIDGHHRLEKARRSGWKPCGPMFSMRSSTCPFWSAGKAMRLMSAIGMTS
jgi:hypothetical protein